MPTAEKGVHADVARAASAPRAAVGEGAGRPSSYRRRRLVRGLAVAAVVTGSILEVLGASTRQNREPRAAVGVTHVPLAVEDVVRRAGVRAAKAAAKGAGQVELSVGESRASGLRPGSNAPAAKARHCAAAGPRFSKLVAAAAAF